jgi:hypothetical protein
MGIEELWYPYRWGIILRGKLRKFASSYGGRFLFIRRPLAVFINSLLDEKHQETFIGTPHSTYKINNK